MQNHVWTQHRLGQNSHTAVSFIAAASVGALRQWTEAIKNPNLCLQCGSHQLSLQTQQPITHMQLGLHVQHDRPANCSSWSSAAATSQSSTSSAILTSTRKVLTGYANSLQKRTSTSIRNPHGCVCSEHNPCKTPYKTIHAKLKGNGTLTRW